MIGLKKVYFCKTVLITTPRFHEAKKQKEMKEYLVLGNSNEVLRIATEDILYVSAMGNYTVFHFTYGDTESMPLSIAKIEESINILCPQTSKDFVRVGRSLIINLSHLLKVDVVGQKLVLLDRNKERKEVEASNAPLKELVDYIRSSAIR